LRRHFKHAESRMYGSCLDGEEEESSLSSINVAGGSSRLKGEKRVRHGLFSLSLSLSLSPQNNSKNKKKESRIFTLHLKPYHGCLLTSLHLVVSCGTVGIVNSGTPDALPLVIVPIFGTPLCPPSPLPLLGRPTMPPRLLFSGPARPPAPAPHVVSPLNAPW